MTAESRVAAAEAEYNVALEAAFNQLEAMRDLAAREGRTCPEAEAVYNRKVGCAAAKYEARLVAAHTTLPPLTWYAVAVIAAATVACILFIVITNAAAVGIARQRIKTEREAVNELGESYRTAADQLNERTRAVLARLEAGETATDKYLAQTAKQTASLAALRVELDAVRRQQENARQFAENELRRFRADVDDAVHKARQVVAQDALKSSPLGGGHPMGGARPRAVARPQQQPRRFIDKNADGNFTMASTATLSGIPVRRTDGRNLEHIVADKYAKIEARRQAIERIAKERVKMARRAAKKPNLVTAAAAAR